MRNWLGHLKAKVLAFGIAMSVLPLAVFGLYSLQAATADQVELVQSQNRAVSRTVADQLSHGVGRIQTELNLLARLGAGRLLTLGPQDRERALYTLLRDLPHLEDVALTGPTGQELVRASRREVTTGVALPSHAGTALWRELMAGRSGIGPVTLDLDGRPLLHLGVPLPDGEGALIGRATLRALVAEISAVRRDGAARILVLDGEGRLIGGSDFSPVLRGLRFTGAVTGNLAYASVTGEEVLGVSAPVPGLGWSVLGETARSEALAPVRRLAGEFAVTALVLMGVVVALSVVFGLQLTEPLERLEAGARRIGAGDLAYRIPPGGRDELGRLVGAFNAMAERLQMTLQAEKLAAVGQLATGVAHEINNPLAVIAGHAEDLQDRLKSEGAQTLAASGQLDEYLSLLQVQVQRCKGITGNLLDFAHRKPADPEDVDFAAVAAQTAALVGHRARRSGVRLAVPDTPVFVHGARDHLQQVVLNLVTNALDALEEQGRGGEIRVSAETRGERVQVAVADDGPGMAPEVLERALEPFFTTKPPGRGTGLGLSICYGLVTAMGGWMRVESTPGAGTIVTLDLPGVSA